MDLLKKSNVSKMRCELKNIYNVLKVAFETLGPADNANLVVAIGNTGCGKSTMLSSILFGPEFLENKQITEEITSMKKNFKTKQMEEVKKIKKRMVIEQKEEFLN